MAAVSVPKTGRIIETDAEKAVFAKVNWHIVPLLLIAYVFAYIDRVNTGFAQLQMKHDLAFSDAVFAAGAGMFFVGYFLFEVPSNLLLEKIGARKTMLRIMVLWGSVATVMAYVTAPWQFYLLRFLLGVFEAGFFPGVILYFTYWYPPARRCRTIAVFMTATAFAAILVGPLNGALMKFSEGFLGHHGWQWMYIANGLPCLLIGVIAFFTLSDGPAQARWLSPAEKKTIADALSRYHVSSGQGDHGYRSLLVLLRDPKVFALSTIYLLMLSAIYVLVFWSPTMIQSWGVKDVFHVGLLKAIPALCGVIAMVLIGRSSDYFGDRRWHYVACAALIVTFVIGIAMSKSELLPSMICYSIATMGTASVTPLFFAFVSEYLPKEQAAGGIALISSLGNIGPSISPSISAWILATTGNQANSLYFVAGLALFAGLIMAFAGRPREVPTAVPQAA